MATLPPTSALINEPKPKHELIIFKLLEHARLLPEDMICRLFTADVQMHGSGRNEGKRRTLQKLFKSHTESKNNGHM